MSLFLQRVFQSENKTSKRRRFKQVAYLFAFFSSPQEQRLDRKRNFRTKLFRKC